jgi:4-amino-4-deoxy-L-arabinose transferase-like glycosyltransferase
VINEKSNSLLIYLLITLGGMLLFFPFLGAVPLFDWDEVNFAEIAREMMVTKDYLNVQIDYTPFWEKPPLFIWMQVVSMKLFGVNEFAARFPNAICGIATLLVIFSIGKRIYNEKMGIIWVLVYAGSILPFFYFKSGIIDPWFNLFIFTGVYFAVIYLNRSGFRVTGSRFRVPGSGVPGYGFRVPGFRVSGSGFRVPGFQGSRFRVPGSRVPGSRFRVPGSGFQDSNDPDPVLQSYSPTVLQSSHPIFLFLSGTAIGLAILTKGPVAFLIFGITGFVYLITLLIPYRPKVLKASPLPPFPASQHPRIHPTHILLFLLGLLLTGGSWFMIQIANGHLDTVKDFIIYQARLFSTKDAGHGGFPGYHVVVLLFGVFPASAFLFSGFKSSTDEKPLQKEWRRACIILLLTVVILFEIVQTKIVHYSSLAYFPLTYLSALAVYRIVEGKSRLNKPSAIVLIILAILWIAVIIGFTVVGLNKEWLMNSGFIKDPFAVANLAADVKWTGWELLVSGVMVIGLVGFFLIKKPLGRMIALFGSTMIFTFLVMIVFTGKIEGYAQQAPIDFYGQHSEEDCYINTLGFKSYAHLYYGKKLPQANPLSYDKDWLLGGKIDKPAYFVYKMTKKDEYSRLYPQLVLLYEKNGFIFAARYPEKPIQGL